jgi:DNA-binding LacI/PurR family transcriptional regulator
MAQMADNAMQPICPPLPENAVREDQGYAAVKGLFRDKIAFDGLFCANDFIALGAMRALEEQDITIGQDVRVIGFDGIAMGAYAQPPLTTIEQDYVQAGEMLVDALIAVLKGEAPSIVPVPVRLLTRGTA